MGPVFLLLPSPSLWEEMEGAEMWALNMREIGKLSLDICQEEVY